MSKYKVYEFSYRGEYLGGVLLVVATSEEDAFDAAKAELSDQKRNLDSLKLEKTSKIKDKLVVYNFNGDY